MKAFVKFIGVQGQVVYIKPDYVESLTEQIVDSKTTVTRIRFISGYSIDIVAGADSIKLALSR